jgi:hypothetical protein
MLNLCSLCCRMMKIYERTRKSLLTGEFFAANEFNFKNAGLKELAASLHFKDRHK